MIDFKMVFLFAVWFTAVGSAVAAPSSAKGNGTYAGIGFGSAEILSDDTSEHYDDTNIRAFLGYQLNQYFAIEGGLSVIPLDDLVDEVADLTGMDVSVLAILPVTSKLSAYARLGYWDWDVNLSDYGVNYNLFGGTDALYGIGLEYKMSPRFKLRADITRYELDGDNLDTLNGSIAYSW